MVVIICHYVTGAKFKEEEVLTHIKHYSVLYMDTYPSIFLDKIQTFSIKNDFKWPGYSLGEGELDTQWDLNVLHAADFKSASNPSIRF